MKKEVPAVRTFLVLGIMAALALAGCTQDDQDSSKTMTQAGQANGDTLADFLAYTRQTQYDYEPADTPTDLAAQADAVVTGTIVDVKPGESYAPTPQSHAEVTTSVLEVKVDEVLSGDASVVADGSVYMRTLHQAFGGTGVEGGPVVPFDHAAYAAMVPRESGVFFLVDVTEEPPWKTVFDEGAGRPAGARITAPLVQGFLIEDESGKLVSVLETFDAMPRAWRSFNSADEVIAEVESPAH